MSLRLPSLAPNSERHKPLKEANRVVYSRLRSVLAALEDRFVYRFEGDQERSEFSLVGRVSG